MPIVMDNGARASFSLPLAFLSPFPCLSACFPQETRAGGWALWWPSVTFKPLPSGSFRGALWRRWRRGCREVHLSTEKEKKGGTDRGSPYKPPVPRYTPRAPPQFSQLPPAEILSVSVRWGPHCERACRWRKGPFGGKQFSCPLWSQWGHIPLLWASVSSRYWSPRRSAALAIHTRWATKSLNLLAHYHLLSASPPFIIPYSDQYCWLRRSVSQKTSWIASCWLFSRIACFLNSVQWEGQLYELIKACMRKNKLFCHDTRQQELSMGALFLQLIPWLLIAPLWLFRIFHPFL